MRTLSTKQEILDFIASADYKGLAPTQNNTGDDSFGQAIEAQGISDYTDFNPDLAYSNDICNVPSKLLEMAQGLLGLDQSILDEIAQISFETNQEDVDTLKRKIRHQYGQINLWFHPDRNHGQSVEEIARDSNARLEVQYARDLLLLQITINNKYKFNKTFGNQGWHKTGTVDLKVAFYNIGLPFINLGVNYFNIFAENFAKLADSDKPLISRLLSLFFVCVGNLLLLPVDLFFSAIITLARLALYTPTLAIGVFKLITLPFVMLVDAIRGWLSSNDNPGSNNRNSYHDRTDDNAALIAGPKLLLTYHAAANVEALPTDSQSTEQSTELQGSSPDCDVNTATTVNASPRANR